MSYFICRRAFRDGSGPVPVGSVVDPTGVKRFRYRLQEGHIVEVTEQNFEKFEGFFKQRYGIDIPSLEEQPVDVPKPEEPVSEETKPEEPVSEETKPEEPVSEETKPEEPVSEEPKPEEPVSEETKPKETVSEETKPKETVSEETKPIRAKAVSKAK